jgi:succinate dehydrogenase / fumarate reductase cytochrome b subunit
MDSASPSRPASPTTRPATLRRPKYYDLNLAHLPPPGLVSIIHRVSGALLFFPILPGIFYVMQMALGSEQSFAQCREFFGHPLVKLAVIGMFWLYAHHFFAGIRYLLLDVHVGIMKQPARTSAVAVLVLGVVATPIFAWRMW